jgi:hypothetical protein
MKMEPPNKLISFFRVPTIQYKENLSAMATFQHELEEPTHEVPYAVMRVPGESCNGVLPKYYL